MKTQPSGVGRDVLIAGLSTLGSVAVALIGVLPQMRKDDSARIGELKAQLERVCRSYGCDAQGRGSWTVHGTVKPTAPGARAADYQVYLVPERRVQTTGDDGSFVFADVQPGFYSIVARELSAGSSRTVRGAVNRYQFGDSLTLQGARLDYRVLDPQQALLEEETPSPLPTRVALASGERP